MGPGRVADPEMVILDSETTGLDGYAVQIAVLSAAGGVLLDTLLHPQESIPVEATVIHGITDADVADAPVFTAIVDRLATVLRNKRVVVYNAAFDAAVLRRELERYAEWWGDWHPYWGKTTPGNPSTAGTTLSAAAGLCCSACTRWQTRARVPRSARR
ncbi:3'-5' exonuclease [Haloactinomyces albus]|uniref:DNA polymerase III epsilon subunit-like protein n=1 Tax=Haloactinomyces albus TaxID=1352928 RepID=A0AAE3ZIJ6_9ACTN|nr:3'-5' exonuclease [Haloactinomyces albus]MDR7303862.1 DNA polymerase III epsilon subunit-like protein [Haloactinomyces albus]